MCQHTPRINGFHGHMLNAIIILLFVTFIRVVGERPPVRLSHQRLQ